MSGAELVEAEIAIVGGGMVGAAFALAMAQAGHRVAVLERRAPAMPEGPRDIRVSALTRASENLLRGLGAWDALRPHAFPYQRMHVWDQAGKGEVDFDCAELGEANLGHIIENRHIQFGLWQALREQDARLIAPDTLSEYRAKAGSAVLELESGSRLSAELVVAADGADSALRRLAGLTARGWDYEQRAVVANLRVHGAHERTAWQRFLPNGPLALLPLADDLVSIVWSTSPAEAERLLALPDDAFAGEVSVASERRLGELELASRRAAFPLRLRHAPSYVSEGLVLVGDAAHVVHPLAGQGVNLGFLDAALLRDVLIGAAHRGRPLGALSTLRKYERARKGDNLIMLGAMDGLKRLFSNDVMPLRWARNAGLSQVNNRPWLRAWFAQQALGLQGELPELARHRS